MDKDFAICRWVSGRPGSWGLSLELRTECVRKGGEVVWSLCRECEKTFVASKRNGSGEEGEVSIYEGRVALALRVFRR